MPRAPHCPPPRHRAARGFTIIELMTVVVIVGILAAVALPNLRDVVVSNRVKTAATDLHYALTLARSEAIKRNAQVDVKPVSTSNWALGWSIVIDPGGTPKNLWTQDAFTSVIFSGPSASISYLGSGRISATTSQSFTARSADYTHIQARCILIDPSGRPNVKTDSDSDYSNGCN